MNAICKFEVYLNNKKDYKIIHELMFEQKKIMNTTINAAYEFFTFRLDYKEKHGLYPKPDKILEKENEDEFYKTFDGYIDSYLAKKYINNNSGNRTSAIKKALKRFSNDKTDILKGLKTLAVFKKSDSITLHNRSIHLYKEDKKYYADLSLISEIYKKELELKSGKKLFNMVVKDKFQRIIIARILEGKYNIKESQLRYDKKNKKFMLFLTYNFEPEIKDRINIMGVSIGMLNSAYMAIHDSTKKYKIEGGEIEAFRMKIEAERYKKRQHLLVCGTGRKNRGRKCFLKNVVKISDKIKRFRVLTNNRYAKRIVDLAIRNNCNEIRMENLTNITKGNLFLKDWSYYDLQQKITFKCAKAGIKTTLVDTKDAITTCSKCGNKENNEITFEFKCQKCGLSIDIDYNSALNIANPN